MGIEFEGSYDKKSIHKKAAFTEQPSQKFLIRRIILVIFLALILASLVKNIYQSKEYFSRNSLYAAIITYFIYYMIIQPYIAPYLEVVQSGRKSKGTSFRRGTISSEGITYISTDNIETISWNKIYRAKQTDDLIVLFADYSSSMAFPRSFFKNESDWQQFKRWVDFYIKER